MIKSLILANFPIGKIFLLFFIELMIWKIILIILMFLLTLFPYSLNFLITGFGSGRQWKEMRIYTLSMLLEDYATKNYWLLLKLHYRVFDLSLHISCYLFLCQNLFLCSDYELVMNFFFCHVMNLFLCHVMNLFLF